MLSTSILSTVTLPGHKVKIQAACSTVHKVLAAQRQHQGTLSAFLQASGSAADKGTAAPPPQIDVQDTRRCSGC